VQDTGVWAEKLQELRAAVMILQNTKEMNHWELMLPRHSVMVLLPVVALWLNAWRQEYVIMIPRLLEVFPARATATPETGREEMQGIHNATQ
jgi:hypothetical protein